MKKLFVIAVLLGTIGCAPAFMTTSGLEKRVHIGMSLNEFKRLTSIQALAELDFMTAEETVYRVDEYSGEEGHRYMSRSKLFHFDADEKLFKVETIDMPVRPLMPPHFQGGYGRH